MAQNRRARTVEEEIAARRELEEGYQPKTKLGESLWKARQEFLRSGEPFLDADGLEREIAERRGGVGFTSMERDEKEKEETLQMTREEEFRSEFDHLLMKARQEYARSGEPWLDADGLEREIAERRGGVREED
ncbi:MAG: hypothetical protein JF614_30925 [Acidobacteria bacterium]|nr:hypothetical protein [Acidobacteriota bacterium]